MTFQRDGFNTYFRLIGAVSGCLIVVALVCGCQTESRKKKRAASTLRVHLECTPYETDRNEFIAIPRDHPTKICIERQCILTEANVAEAKVISEMDGFTMVLQFENRGKLVLEQYTAANHGHRLAIFTQFGQNLSSNRWLAAPLITHVIKNGTLSFTPDASRAEADQIVLGLNNVAKKVAERDW